MLCYIAINGLGGCRGEIKPEQEATRSRLEQEFMASGDKCYVTTGWKSLAVEQKAALDRILLKVFVADENLARQDRRNMFN